MSTPGIFRNVNILREINVSHGSDLIDIYQPGWLNSLDVVGNLKYSGFISSLRLTVDITSIQELSVIPSDILASDEVLTANRKATFDGNQKKSISFYMKTSDTPLLKIADVYLFNQRPYYYIDLLKYFTLSSTFDIAPDAQLSMRMSSTDTGALQGNDRILLLGTVIEESPVYDQSFIIAE